MNSAEKTPSERHFPKRVQAAGIYKAEKAL